MKATYNPNTKKDGMMTDQILTGGQMIAGGKLQSIHEVSTVQNYDIGTRLVQDDRVFRYSKAAAILKGLMGANNANFPREGSTDAVEYAAGTYQITIPMNSNGDDYVAEQVKDYWKNGYIWIMQWPIVTGYGQLHRIKSSAAASGGFVVLTLWDPLDVKVGATTWITAWANPYSNIKSGLSARMSIVCVPLVPVALGSYFWGQTWGPIFASCTNMAPGREDHDREIYFTPGGTHEGEIRVGSQVDFSTVNNKIPQRAGFLLTNTTAWTNAAGDPELGGDQFFMLQLSP